MQIVGYETGAATTAATGSEGGTDGESVGGESTAQEAASLLLTTDDGLERVPLEPGRSLDYRLESRHCAGVIDDEGHEPCDAPEAPYCPDHTDRWACARCTGNCDLPLPNCHEEHAVYLAGFRPATFKVGVTKSWRLETRLREQGADRGAHLRTVKNGRIAREIEFDIAADVGDSVRVDAKIRGLHEAFEEDAWRDLLADYDHLATYDFDYGLDLSDRPMQEALASGRVRGTKGRVLLLDNGGSTYAVDLRDLVGYEVDPGGTDRQLQSSLRAWD